MGDAKGWHQEPTASNIILPNQADEVGPQDIFTDVKIQRHHSFEISPLAVGGSPRKRLLNGAIFAPAINGRANNGAREGEQPRATALEACPSNARQKS